MFLFSCKFLNIFFLQDSVTILSQVCFILIKENGLEGGGLKILVGQTVNYYISIIILILIGLDSHMKKQTNLLFSLGRNIIRLPFLKACELSSFSRGKICLVRMTVIHCYSGMQKITTNVFTCLSENPVASNQLIWYSNTLMTEGYNKQV